MDKKFLGLFSIFFLVFAFFSILVVARDPIARRIRASTDKTPSSSSSVLLLWPLVAKVGSQSTITAFVRSLSGKPVSDRIVSFTSDLGVISQKAVSSDGSGKAETTITCDREGIAHISATIDEQTAIEQQITLECKNSL